VIWLIIALVWIAFIPFNYLLHRYDWRNSGFCWTVGERTSYIIFSLIGPLNIFNIIIILSSFLNKKYGLVDWNKEAKW